MKLSIRQRKAGDDFPFVSLEEKDLSLDKAKETEWILTNGLGGYSSSTVIELNTRKYHGLLVSSNDLLERYVTLHKLEEEIHKGKSITRLSTNEYKDRALTDGWRNLKRFSHSFDSVSFEYNSWTADVVKKISAIHDVNGVIVSYHIKNKTLEDIRFKVNVLVNPRSIYELTKMGSKEFKLKGIDEKTFGLRTKDIYLKLHSDNAVWKETEEYERWLMDVYYSVDAERGDSCMEDLYFPAYYSLDIPAGATEDLLLTALAYEDRRKTRKAIKNVEKSYKEKGRLIGGGKASSLYALLSNAEGFVVKRGKEKTVIAGYHWFGEWGRDAMISLPGLTLVNNRLHNAEGILKHFLSNMTDKGIPNSFAKGVPQYTDYDSTLWMIDRLHQFMKYAGRERTQKLLKPHWPKVKGFIENHIDLTKDGLLMHGSGTWMDTLERNNAVEIQALWYNALKLSQEYASMLKDKRFDVSEACKAFEENFFSSYWNGKCLDDCLGDNSLRPNQVIAISLEHSVVDAGSARKILEATEKELLTPYGLRTLRKRDRKYRGRYEGGVQEREKAYHNGTVWPWLLGPYVKAYIKYGGSKDSARALLDSLFEKHLREAGIGCVSEIFDGDEPYKPRGCISQAWSVAEPLRAYFEDVEGRRTRQAL